MTLGPRPPKPRALRPFLTSLQAAPQPPSWPNPDLLLPDLAPQLPEPLSGAWHQLSLPDPARYHPRLPRAPSLALQVWQDPAPRTQTEVLLLPMLSHLQAFAQANLSTGCSLLPAWVNP